MNSMERIRLLTEGIIPDRVPVICNLLEQGALELGLTLKEYYSSGEHVAEAQLRMQRKYGYDNLWGFFYVAKDAEMFGCRKIIYAEDGPPNVGELIIRNPADIEALTVPADVSETEAFQELRKCIRILQAEQGGRCPVLGSVVASFSLPPMLMGMDKWLQLLLTGPKSLCRELLEKCSDFCISHIRALRKAGIDMIAYSNPVASATFLTLPQFRDLALPWIQRDFDAVGTEGLVYFNGGGVINSQIGLILEQTGIGAFYINPLDDVTEAKRIVNGKALVAGVINDIKLINWDDEAIQKDVARIMAAGAPGGGFLFGTLVMPLQIPEEKIKTMLEAAFRYGQYPGNTG
ncbi:MAG: uroporphyrinogen decarboxylase family protein [Geobacteraceae bacterium]|nr:uroporphyrinogen decarboxylase family protein [Geobacteraceae bacterium]